MSAIETKTASSSSGPALASQAKQFNKLFARREGQEKEGDTEVSGQGLEVSPLPIIGAARLGALL